MDGIIVSVVIVAIELLDEVHPAVSAGGVVSLDMWKMDVVKMEHESLHLTEHEL